MLDYFSEYYVNGKAVPQVYGNIAIIRFHEPSFPPPMWNVRNATLEGMDRTNNRCEGNNNRLNGNAGRPGAGGVPKMGVYAFTDFIQVGIMRNFIENYLELIITPVGNFQTKAF